MKKNERSERDEKNLDNDQLRDNTMNESIREARGSSDADLNNLRDNVNDEYERRGERQSGAYTDTDQTRGVSYTPNDASAVRSGGTTDMDDQTAGGAGLNTGIRKGAGSNLTTKKGVSGSDFDGQNATS